MSLLPSVTFLNDSIEKNPWTDRNNSEEVVSNKFSIGKASNTLDDKKTHYSVSMGIDIGGIEQRQHVGARGYHGVATLDLTD